MYAACAWIVRCSKSAINIFYFSYLANQIYFCLRISQWRLETSVWRLSNLVGRALNSWCNRLARSYGWLLKLVVLVIFYINFAKLVLHSLQIEGWIFFNYPNNLACVLSKYVGIWRKNIYWFWTKIIYSHLIILGLTISLLLSLTF